jgi:hypothetical protein
MSRMHDVDEPDDTDDPDDMEVLDERIAALGDAAERCRKVSLGAKILTGAGATYLVAFGLGIVSSEPSLTIAAIAAVLGGLVLLGSNASTWDQTEAALAAAYAARDGARVLAAEGEAAPPARRPALRLVGDDRPTLH